MDRLEFKRRFATNDACRGHLFKIRWPEGPACAKCGGRNFCGISARNVCERRCGMQASLRKRRARNAGGGTEKTLAQTVVSLGALEDVSGDSIRAFVEGNIAEKGLSCEPTGSARAPRCFTGGNPEHLKWLHRVAGNAKALLLGTYHGLEKKHLQVCQKCSASASTAVTPRGDGSTGC